jgi:hypothetical protein
LNIPHFQGRRLSALATVSPRQVHPSVSYEELRIPLERLDSILSEKQSVSFIKCDVEGHELAVLRGAESTLRYSLPAILIEIEQRHMAAGSIHDTFNYLINLGYVGFALYETGARSIREFDVQRDQLKFVSQGFVAYDMPAGYVNDFLFITADKIPPDTGRMERS